MAASSASARLARLLGVAVACLVIAPAARANEDPAFRAYEARYSIYRNGKLTGKAEVELEWDRGGTRWSARSNGSGTHGLARLLGARDSEETRGVRRDGRFWPQHYRRHTQIAGLDDLWAVDFDYEARLLRVAHDGGTPVTVAMVDVTVDPLTLKLELRRLLAEQDGPFAFHMVKEDEIDEQRFRQLPEEWLETSLGCLRTRPVEKIRENGKRYTRAWHAPALGWIEVRMEHGKTGGNHHEMRLSELSFDGQAVTPRPGCAARQQGGQP